MTSKEEILKHGEELAALHEQWGKKWEAALDSRNSLLNENDNLMTALEEIRTLTFGPHEKPHATIFNIIKVVKKSIGLNTPSIKKELSK